MRLKNNHTPHFPHTTCLISFPPFSIGWRRPASSFSHRASTRPGINKKRRFADRRFCVDKERRFHLARRNLAKAADRRFWITCFQ